MEQEVDLKEPDTELSWRKFLKSYPDDEIDDSLSVQELCYRIMKHNRMIWSLSTYPYTDILIGNCVSLRMRDVFFIVVDVYPDHVRWSEFYAPQHHRFVSKEGKQTNDWLTPDNVHYFSLKEYIKVFTNALAVREEMMETYAANYQEYCDAWRRSRFAQQQKKKKSKRVGGKSNIAYLI